MFNCLGPYLPGPHTEFLFGLRWSACKWQFFLDVPARMCLSGMAGLPIIFFFFSGEVLDCFQEILTDKHVAISYQWLERPVLFLCLKTHYARSLHLFWKPRISVLHSVLHSRSLLQCLSGRHRRGHISQEVLACYLTYQIILEVLATIRFSMHFRIHSKINSGKPNFLYV